MNWRRHQRPRLIEPIVLLDGQVLDGKNRPAACRLAGVVGPRGDAYWPEEATAEDEASAYHLAQVEALTGGVDLLYAPTSPVAGEALGVARAISETGLLYVVSPSVTRMGNLLEGTPLAQLIDRIDEAVSPRPACYKVSCVNPRCSCPTGGWAGRRSSVG
jgi:S-methylmethionine-dependent homocysteine/selenocysteine methylase